MNSIIDFSSLSDPATKLIEKMSDAIGWVATHKTLRRTATDSFVASIEKSNIDPLDKAILIGNASKIIKETKNQKDIIDIALVHLREDSHPERVDNDWISLFMDKSRLVSDKDFQVIWGKILAEECNEDGSIPRRLLGIMQEMEKDDAKSFTQLCNYSVKVINKNGEIEYSPIVFISKLYDTYKGLTYEALLNLESLGLISISEIGFTTDSVSSVEYHNHKYKIPLEKNIIVISNVLFTKAGVALYKSIESEEIEGFFEDVCIPFLTRKPYY